MSIKNIITMEGYIPWTWSICRYNREWIMLEIKGKQTGRININCVQTLAVTNQQMLKLITRNHNPSKGIAMVYGQIFEQGKF